MDMRYFLALSTGQNVANVVPTLENWEPGDRLLWLDSEYARQRGWSHGALTVLTARGVPDTHIEPLHYGEAPRELFEVLSRRLTNISHEDQILWIGNGGTKPQALAAGQALRSWAGHFTVLYNSNRAVGCDRFSGGMSGEQTFERHVRAEPLTLEELLTISGYVPFEQEPLQRIWPGESPPEAPLDYGYDTQATLDEYEERFAWWLHTARGDEDASLQLHMPAMREKDPRGFEQWRAKYEPQWRGICRKINTGTAASTHFDQIFNHILVYIEAYRKQERRATLEVSKPTGLGGTRFEQAVARRLHDWLEEHEQQPIRDILSGVWANVRIARSSAPTQVVQELDLALLLRNGVLLAIECKAGQFNNKDLDARLLNIQSSASLESSMGIVIPVFTDYKERPGHLEMIRRWRRLQGLRRFRAIPFTLAGQPPECVDPKHDQVLSIPSFEQALSNWLSSYTAHP